MRVRLGAGWAGPGAALRLAGVMTLGGSLSKRPTSTTKHTKHTKTTVMDLQFGLARRLPLRVLGVLCGSTQPLRGDADL